MIHRGFIRAKTTSALFSGFSARYAEFHLTTRVLTPPEEGLHMNHFRLCFLLGLLPPGVARPSSDRDNSVEQKQVTGDLPTTSAAVNAISKPEWSVSRHFTKWMQIQI